jgi:hypothetical protein
MAHKRETVQLYMIESQYTEYGYNHTRIEIKPGSEESLAILRTKAPDNYKDPGIAEKQIRMYSWLLDHDYLGMWNSSWEHAPFEFEWQHYKPYDATPETPHTYCEVSIKLGRKLDEIKSGTKLVERILAKAAKLGHHEYATLHDPKYIRDTLARMGAKPLTRVVIPPEACGYTFRQVELCTSRVLASVEPLLRVAS